MELGAYFVDNLLGDGSNGPGAKAVGVHEDVWQAGPAGVQILHGYRSHREHSIGHCSNRKWKGPWHEVCEEVSDDVPVDVDKSKTCM